MTHFSTDYPIVYLQQAKGSSACEHRTLKPQKDLRGYFTGAYLCMKCGTLVTLPNNSPVAQSIKDSTTRSDWHDDLVQRGTSVPAVIAAACRAAGMAVKAWFGLK
jgi:hypothetical protein